MKNKIYNNLIELMMLPGLSGHESRVCNHISNKLKRLGLFPKKDVMGNLWVSFPGEGPNIMLFTHMDQIGFVVRKIEKNGFILTPGRYVGAPVEVDDGEPFDKKMRRLTSLLKEQQEEGAQGH